MIRNNSYKKISLLVKIFSIFLIFNSLLSFASSESTSFTVTATVADTCQNLTAENINFGSYNPLSGSPADSTGNIQITCTNNTAYSVALSSGSSGSYTTRQLNDSGSNNLKYNLYTTNAYSTVWGDGTAGSATIDQTGTGIQDTMTVYGRIPAGQSVANASYSDTINVTVTY